MTTIAWLSYALKAIYQIIMKFRLYVYMNDHMYISDLENVLAACYTIAMSLSYTVKPLV